MTDARPSPPHASPSAEVELRGMSEQLAQAYEELTLLHRLSGTLRVERPPTVVLEQACGNLATGAGLRFAAIRLADRPGLGELAGTLVVATGTDAAGLRVLVAAAADELVARGPEPFPGSILVPAAVGGLPSLARLGTEAIAVPLHLDGKTAGWLFGAARAGVPALTSAEAKLAEAVAGPLAIFLENRLLYEQAQALSTGVLASLVRTIDAKDPATRGHSERVGTLAAELGVAMDLPPAECERLHLAGLVHDLGKLGVPESILLKRGRLTPEEFDRIREHPDAGVRILDGLAPLRDLLPAVKHHHERWDGTGYPDRLAGERIPFWARIVGVVDAYDAIRSSRSYREGSTADEGLAELQRCSGTHFDPAVVEAFLRSRASAQPPLRRAA